MPEPIVLPRGHQLIVDDTDRELVLTHLWHAIPARETFYAQSGLDTNVYVHRLLMAAPAGVLVDHINRNGLDNRRVNLRLCNQSQNKANRPAPANNTSGYKGVSKKRPGVWVARITVDYRSRHLGTFTDPWLAAQAYNTAALEAWGDFALLNVPPPDLRPGAQLRRPPVPLGRHRQPATETHHTETRTPL